MPLSEEELRLLEQMEQALAQEDPKFVSTLRGSTLARAAKVRTAAAAGVFVLGVVLLMAGAVSQQTWLGIVGFVVMLASATLGLAAWRGRHAPPAKPQRSEDQLFDFDDHPHRFDVIDGGRGQRSRKVRRTGRKTPKVGRTPSPKPSGTFMQRMEQRWERRRQQGY